MDVADLATLAYATVSLRHALDLTEGWEDGEGTCPMCLGETE